MLRVSTEDDNGRRKTFPVSIDHKEYFGKKRKPQHPKYSLKFEKSIYATAASMRKDRSHRYAVCNCLMNKKNEVHIVQVKENKDTTDDSLQTVFTINHEFPATKMMFVPSPLTSQPDLLATAGQYLQVFRLGSGKLLKKRAMILSAMKKSQNVVDRFQVPQAPLTSFDWNRIDITSVITSSIDTTCRLWDLQKSKLKVQLIAHQQEVYDVSYHPRNSYVFSSCGKDGQVRVFDLRNLQKSTIVYESKSDKENLITDGSGLPILRVQFNRLNTNQMCLLFQDRKNFVIVDIRMPGRAMLNLYGHGSNVNSITWAPHSPSHIMSVGDDSQALVWDTSVSRKEAVLGFISKEGPISSVVWNEAETNWVCLGHDKNIELMKV